MTVKGAELAVELQSENRRFRNVQIWRLYDIDNKLIEAMFGSMLRFSFALLCACMAAVPVAATDYSVAWGPAKYSMEPILSTHYPQAPAARLVTVATNVAGSRQADQYVVGGSGSLTVSVNDAVTTFLFKRLAVDVDPFTYSFDFSTSDGGVPKKYSCTMTLGVSADFGSSESLPLGATTAGYYRINNGREPLTLADSGSITIRGQCSVTGAATVAQEVAVSVPSGTLASYLSGPLFMGPGSLPDSIHLTRDTNEAGADRGLGFCAVRWGGFNDWQPVEVFSGTVDGVDITVSIQLWVFAPADLTLTPAWAEWSRSSGGWIDTGRFLGVIYPTDSGWDWSACLQHWIFLPEAAVRDGGAWVWVAR